jgi:hypothetical protein
VSPAPSPAQFVPATAVAVTTAVATAADAVSHPDAPAVSGTARCHAISPALVEPSTRAVRPTRPTNRSGAASGAPFRAAAGTEAALASCFVTRALALP